ncbi:MAG TPA: hypothetical protein VGD08_13710 [Stellaceae bacterium]
MTYRRHIIDEVNAALPVVAIGLGILDVVLFVTLHVPTIAENAGCIAVPTVGASCADLSTAHGAPQQPGSIAAARMSVTAVR